MIPSNFQANAILSPSLLQAERRKRERYAQHSNPARL